MFGLFNKEKSLQKTIDKATNSLAQSPDRWAAMEKLKDIGTDEALMGLCRRFSVTASKIIEDQQEKDWVVSALASMGEACLGPLRRYMKDANQLGYPLAVVGKVTSGDKTLEVIDELLANEEPGYVRDPKRRTDIIEWLGEWEGDAEAVSKRVLPYVEDFDENVRFKSIEAISLKPHPSAAETVVRAMTNKEEESQRFQVRCAELIAKHSWPLEPHKEETKELISGPLHRFKIKGDTLETN